MPNFIIAVCKFLVVAGLCLISFLAGAATHTNIGLNVSIGAEQSALQYDNRLQQLAEALPARIVPPASHKMIKGSKQ